ncbi:MAG: lipid IV(A) 3-deoxy-D-manno-octulosonic acid transferase [Steroidobacteraceae bacterium]
MSALYSLFTYATAPWVFVYFLWRSLREPGYRQAFAERLGFGVATPTGGVWVHAVSVGEVRAALPLLEGLLARYPDRPLLLSTVTAGGRLVAEQALAGRATVCYLPLDMPGAVNRFLDRHQPVAGVIIETEIWPNLFRACARRGIPVIIANARLSPRSVRGYRRLLPLLRRTLDEAVTVAAQSAPDADRFMAIGVPPSRTHVVGNLKFDIDIDAGLVRAGGEWRAEQAPGRPVWVAGSTHQGEEQHVLDAHRILLRTHPDALLVLVPRHPARFDEVAEQLSAQGWRWSRRSVQDREAVGREVLLVDTLGELLMFYAGADLAFVGGSLVPIGGHNLLEPVAVGRPTLTGPYNSNSAGVHADLLRAGGLVSVQDGRALGDMLVQLFGDSAERDQLTTAGTRVLDGNRGTVDRLLAMLQPLVATQNAS